MEHAPLCIFLVVGAISNMSNPGKKNRTGVHGVFNFLDTGSRQFHEEEYFYSTHSFYNAILFSDAAIMSLMQNLSRLPSEIHLDILHRSKP